MEFLSGNEWILWVIIFFVFWFFILRPKINAQKKEEEFRGKLHKGQKIITIGGIHGTIIGIQETTVLPTFVSIAVTKKFNCPNLICLVTNLFLF